ncbi:glutamate 5-kinase [Punctularia strigosozonata HHB-11173 SS5]|uniref:glutamate 5-kinase n=1 Tax=Punctularia strigosozonata (strain HHB-11173) TaxID=741275 RepID=UPI0004417BB9|nr:glutamate 5-kinase [Punctularia strigosozonata HHB-11173 SS5]EIN07879.1 glutamate 5-kinase [Punctularia strigosozonata HHB-11173 SS5]
MVKSRPCTIVIKLGSSSIVHEKTHQPLLSTLSALVETVVHLRAAGHKVVLVSSGAIAVGLKRMDMPSRPKSLAGKQALAAVGQGRLIALWDNLFGQFEQPIAQVLLTRGDIADRTRYLNAANTFTELLSMGVVPIVNENDTVSVSEIKFGDNDTLSAITSAMIHADYLFLLTDVDGLYTSNPRRDPNARQIEVVESISAIRKQVSTSTLGSSLGTGGMETKIIAAEIATAAGVATVITSSKRPHAIFDIIEYNHSLAPFSPTAPFPSTPSSLSAGSGSEASELPTPTPKTVNLPHPDSAPASGTVTPARPPHTLFTPSPAPLRDLKSWTSHTLYPSGSVIIDAGAHAVLSRRESGGRLLPVGVVGVEGAFAAGQAVRIVVRRQEGEHEGANLTVSSTTRRSTVDSVSEPPTPVIQAAASMSSSIVSLEPLSSSLESLANIPSSNTLKTVVESTTTTFTQGEGSVVTEEPDEQDWQYLEVGRGLANYNSEQISRVKGLKSSYIPQLLGYADSEYVVENITIRVPP